MSLPTGGKADKLGNKYETCCLILELLRLAKNEISYVIYEPTGSEESGTDYIVGNNDGSITYTQCKSSLGGNNNWSVSNLRPILLKWKDRITEESVKFKIISPLNDSKFLSLLYSVNDYRFNEEKLNKNNRYVLDSLFDCVGLDYKNNNDFKIMINFLSRIEFKVESFNAIKEHVCNKIDLNFRGDSNLNYNLLYSEIANGDYFGKMITINMLNKILSKLSLKFRDLSSDVELLGKINYINKYFKNEYKMVNDEIIKHKDISSIFDKVKMNEISVIYGNAGVGKSGICLQLIECFKRDGIPFFATELDVYKPECSLEVWSKNLSLPDNIPYCIDAISKGTKAILLFDQVDDIHYFNSNSKNAIRICNEIIDKIKTINKEREIKNQISIVFVSREYDLKNDLLISGLKLPNIDNNDCYIEITELSDNELKQIIGTSYVNLSERTKVLLKNFNNLYIYNRVKNKKRIYLNTNDLIGEWYNQICEDAKQKDCKPHRIFLICNEIKNQFLENNNNFVIITKTEFCCTSELDLLLSTGFLIKTDDKVMFEHQSILDYFISYELQDKIQTNKVDIVEYLSNLKAVGLKKRYLVVLVLQNIILSDVDLFIKISDSVLNSGRKVPFHLKSVIFEILSNHSNNRDKRIIEYVVNKTNNKYWSKYFINLVIPSNLDYIIELKECGYLEKMLSKYKTFKDAIMLISSISDKLGSHFDELICKYLFEYNGINREFRWIFSRDINNDSKIVFEMRLSFYKKFPEYLSTIDFKKLFECKSKRIIDIIELILTDKYYKDDKYLYDIFEEFNITENSFYEENYFYIVDKMLKFVPENKVIPFCYSNWCKTSLHGKSIERIVIEMLSKASETLYSKNKTDFHRVFNKFFKLKNDLYNEIILKSFIANVDVNSDEIIDNIVNNFDSIIFSSTYNSNDKLALFKTFILKGSKICSDVSYNKLENAILNYRDNEIIEFKKSHKFKYKLVVPTYGYLQIELLPCLDKRRIGKKTINIINELRRNPYLKNRFSESSLES